MVHCSCLPSWRCWVFGKGAPRWHSASSGVRVPLRPHKEPGISRPGSASQVTHAPSRAKSRRPTHQYAGNLPCVPTSTQGRYIVGTRATVVEPAVACTRHE
jgi:hypothetical protein